MENHLSPETVVEIAVPGFLALIVLEILISRHLGRKTYRLFDSIQDLSLGIYQQMTGILLAAVPLAAFSWTQKHFSLNSWVGTPLWLDDFSPLGIAAWVASFALIDFCFYWFHRSAHKINFLWGSHIAHHSSEEYNLSVALRQSATENFFSLFFFLPLAFIGVTWKQFAIGWGLNLIYQFWVHTRLIGKLGPVEWIMNTPSHHRVHHGRNPRYIDTNFAGVFIVWDRIFGTFQIEDEEPVYGITNRLRSFNPWTANVHHFQHIWRECVSAPNWTDRLNILFRGPGWRSGVGPQEITAEDLIPIEPVKTGKQTLLIVACFTLLLGLGTQILNQAQHGNMLLAKALAVCMLIALTLQGVYIDKKG